MNKQSLRKQYKTKRNDLTESEIITLSQQITQRIKELNIWDKTYYHIFLSITSQKEIRTNGLLAFLQEKEKQVVVPKINMQENKLMNCLYETSTELELNEWNIPEPVFCKPIESKMLEVVFIPLLISDQNGNRIGYGKGFYDQLLGGCKKETIKIGLNFFEPINKITDVYLTDIPLDCLVTPHNTHFY